MSFLSLEMAFLFLSESERETPLLSLTLAEDGLRNLTGLCLVATFWLFSLALWSSAPSLGGVKAPLARESGAGFPGEGAEVSHRATKRQTEDWDWVLQGPV